MSVPIYNRLVPRKKGLFGKKPAILIHTPSMRTPEVIKDSRIIYQCMRTTLIEAIIQDVDHVVIPAFGGVTGRVPCEEIAKMMFLAYKQVYNKPLELNWGYALHIAKEVNNI
jgi:O-acetyl-ADP-ribose deacetylase (regulator of RNase III)